MLYPFFRDRIYSHIAWGGFRKGAFPPSYIFISILLIRSSKDTDVSLLPVEVFEIHFKLSSVLQMKVLKKVFIRRLWRLETSSVKILHVSAEVIFDNVEF